jgi:hypothetical protein
MAMSSRYNEVFDVAGNIRAPYRAFQARTGIDPLHRPADWAGPRAHQWVCDSCAMLPVPLVLDDGEFCKTIAAGVQQRALALQALFHDLVQGERWEPRDRLLPTPLFASILEHHGTELVALRRWWSGRPREHVRFTYAPDLLRGPDGVWNVIEDNVGCVGGIVDAHLVLSGYLRQTGSSVAPRMLQGCDLTRAIDAFLMRVGQTTPSPRVVALVGCEGDAEGQRRRRALQAAGVLVLNERELRNAMQHGFSLRTLAAVVNFDATGWLDASELGEEIRGLGDVALMTAPGVEALGNKALLPFVDDIVALYSNAPPILRAAPTELYRAMPSEPRSRVVKLSNGCQGRHVFFLDALSASARAQLGSDLSARGAAAAVLQAHISASVLPIFSDGTCEEYQVELRPLAWVIGDGVCVVGETPSGRAFRNDDGFGVGNMSRGASYIAVIREPLRG